MNHDETIRKLNELKLFGLAKSFAERRIKPDHMDLSHDEFVGLVVDDEYIYRINKKTTRLLQQAKLKFPSSALEDIDYSQKRGLLKSKIIPLQSIGWITNHQNILITGPTGVGKSYLACAFGTWACRNKYSVNYFRWPRFISHVFSAKGEGKYINCLDKLSKLDLLIIDDFGLNSLSQSDQNDFMEIIEERYMKGSTIITSQLPMDQWHHAIGNPTVADAICDRLFHNAHRIEMKGESMRKKR